MRIANCQFPIANSARGIHRHITTSPDRHFVRAFTLVEMVVVIAIIILLTGLVVPAATQMWKQRKIADAQNMISGMLMTARARAIQSGGAQTGLFFFVDDQGARRVAPITQDPNVGQTDATKIIRGWESDVSWYNVFTAIRGQSFTLPAPMRVLPLYAICDPDKSEDDHGLCQPRDSSDNSRFEYSTTELENPDFASVAIASGTTDTAQAHRNFFTLVFTPSGEMIVQRDVLIRDVDDEAESGTETEGKGVVCGLKVRGSPKNPSSAVSDFFAYFDSSPTPIGVVTASQFPTWLATTDASDVAMNFPSVDGLLVYDDSLFNEAGDPDAKRKYLADQGLPFYINRITGAVIRGPSGEGPAQ